jgi:hypothetical protein
VLWLLLLLSGLAATVAYIARVNSLLTHRAVDIASAELAADAGIANTISLLSDEQTARHPALGGTTRSWQFDRALVTISVHNEAGGIDVNNAPDDLLLAFLQSQGVSLDTSVTLLNDLRVFQNRDEGGNDPQARERNTGIASLGRPLQSVEELREIPSWRARNLNCWMGSLTVYSQRPDLNIAAATPQASAALEWLKSHQPQPENSHAPGPAAGSGDANSVIGEVVRIRATATISNGISATREWVGRLTGDARNPALTMRWSANVWPSAASCVGP